MSDDPVRTASARLATLSRRDRGPVNKVLIEDARDALLAARVERAITEALKPPKPYKPLSDIERTRLMRMLKP